MSKLPASAQKNTDMRAVLDSLLQGVTHQMTLLKGEQNALRAELDFHRQCYATHVEYADGLFSAVAEAYGNFEGDLRASLLAPLTSLLT